MAEVALLRGQLAEANRSKAVLAGKLQQARADCAAMGARLAAGQARHAADLARSAAAAEEANVTLRRETGALRAENQRLLAQAQLLARAAAAAGESERGAALVGIVRQREEQLTAAHLEVARLQVRWGSSRGPEAGGGRAGYLCAGVLTDGSGGTLCSHASLAGSEQPRMPRCCGLLRVLNFMELSLLSLLLCSAGTTP